MIKRIFCRLGLHRWFQETYKMQYCLICLKTRWYPPHMQD